MARYTKRRDESINTWQELSQGIAQNRNYVNKHNEENGWNLSSSHLESILQRVKKTMQEKRSAPYALAAKKIFLDNKWSYKEVAYVLGVYEIDSQKATLTDVCTALENYIDMMYVNRDVIWMRDKLAETKRPWWMRLFRDDSPEMSEVKTALKQYTMNTNSRTKGSLRLACQRYINARLGERSTEVGQKRQDYVYRIWYCVDPERCPLPEHLQQEAEKERKAAEEAARKEIEEEERCKKEVEERLKKEEEERRKKEEEEYEKQLEKDKLWRQDKAHSKGFNEATIKYTSSLMAKNAKKAKKRFDKVAQKVYKKAKIKPIKDLPKNQSQVVYDYTGGDSIYMNRVLAGYDPASWDNYIGPHKIYIFRKSPFLSQTYGQQILDLTDLIAKSKYEFNVWLQSGQEYGFIEKFLDLQTDTLRWQCTRRLVNGKDLEDKGTYENRVKALDFKRYIGKKNVVYQFLSTSVIMGGGGIYNQEPVKLLIYAPKGAEMLYVSDRGNPGVDSDEMILQRGGTYVISNMYMKEDDTDNNKLKLFVEMELHPEVGYKKLHQ